MKEKLNEFGEYIFRLKCSRLTEVELINLAMVALDDHEISSAITREAVSDVLGRRFWDPEIYGEMRLLYTSLETASKQKAERRFPSSDDQKRILSLVYEDFEFGLSRGPEKYTVMVENVQDGTQFSKEIDFSDDKEAIKFVMLLKKELKGS